MEAVQLAAWGCSVGPMGYLSAYAFAQLLHPQTSSQELGPVRFLHLLSISSPASNPTTVIVKMKDTEAYTMRNGTIGQKNPSRFTPFCLSIQNWSSVIPTWQHRSNTIQIVVRIAISEKPSGCPSSSHLFGMEGEAGIQVDRRIEITRKQKLHRIIFPIKLLFNKNENL